MKPLSGLSLTVALILGLGGCSYQQLTRNQLAQTTLSVIEVYDRETDVELARQSLPACLKLLEGTLSRCPDDPVLLTAAVRSFARYTWGFVELEIELADQNGDSVAKAHAAHRAVNLYRRAIAFGHSVLVQADPAFASSALHNLTDLQRALDRIDTAQAEALYWTAFAHGNLLRHSQFRHELLAEIRSVQLMMIRVTQLNRGLLAGRAHAFLGALYTHLPPLWGQDMSLAGEHFEKALNLTDSCYLPVRLAHARYYLLKTAQPQDYLDALKDIAERIPDSHPDWALDNGVARVRAKMYLRREYSQQSGVPSPSGSHGVLPAEKI